jgi:hypothetical protein
MMTDGLLRSFVRRFVSRRDDYAVQQMSGRYLRVGRPLQQRTLFDHFAGLQSLGTYVIDESGSCRYAVFDADMTDGIDVLLDLSGCLADDGIPSCLEQSRRGGHVWVLLDGLYRASQVRRWLLPYCPAGVEFYPKQDEGGGYGSLIRLPLGVHLRSGRRYPFLVWSDVGSLVPVGASVSEQLQWLAMCELAQVPTEVLAGAPGDTPPTSTPPSLAKPVALSSPATSARTIHQWCAAQDPVQVIGRYVHLDGRGLGCCPFGEHHRNGRDVHPSFRVYAPRSASGSCWYCYTSQQGGNVFDFLLRYHGLDARTLWQRIQAGEVS